MPADWAQATRDAMAAWNNLASNRITLVEVNCGAMYSPYARGIYITLGQFPPDTLAVATVGSHYNFKKIWINTNGTGFTSGDLARFTRVMVHELGHNLGYRHTDQTAGCQIPGTPANDNLSIMRSVVQPNWVPIFSPDDIAAHNIVYGNVSNPAEVCMGFLRGCSGNTGTCR